MQRPTLTSITMMATTHGLWGVAAGATVATAHPEAAPAALVAGFVGGVVPDVDVYANHRRTVHAPVYGLCIAAFAVCLALVAPSTLTIVFASFLLGAALHALMDAAGGGLSLEPWADHPDRAVYSHFHGRWLTPRRYVRYDGAPEDLLLAAVVGLPLAVVLSGGFRWAVVSLLCCSVVYVLLRKRLVDIVVTTIRYTPDSLTVVVPRRFDEIEE